jgi:glycosyltransferase involved in cell wall biosynthesis
MTRRALIYSPFDILPGGGEAYLLNAARALSQTHRTVFALPQLISRARIEFTCHALGIEPFPFEVSPLAEAKSHNTEFDVTFVMGNEIVPPISALGRINFYHLQFPFPWRNVGAFDFPRICGYDAVIVNSSFTADWTAKRLEQAGLGGRTPPIHIVPPPVRALPYAPRSPLADRPLRLANVGRFFVGGHSKRQDIFVEIIAQLRAAKVDVAGVLIGSATEDDDAKVFFAKVAERAKAVGVEMLGECSRADIARTLQQTDIYLHCCGYQVDANLAPERVEHFGIAIVEAITAGAYPIVVDAGGPAEIVKACGVGGVFETVKQAKTLIEAFKADPKSISQALPWAESVSEVRFGERLRALVKRYDLAIGGAKRSA